MKENKKLYPIHYLGKTYNTTIHKDLTDEEFEQVRKEYYTKPDFEDVKKQFLKIQLGGVKIDKITNYYVKDLMAKVRVYYNNWTIEEALNYKPLIEFFAGKCDSNKKVYPDTLSLGKKIETAFRLCGFKTASKPSNFPIKTIDEILNNYNINGNYYDYSCGWGSRLLSSLRHNINYFGTDPNYLLCDRLKQMSKDYKDTCKIGTKVDIRSIGSEVFIPEWENTIGVAFSSPPYFSLEDYGIGNQSYKPGMKYIEWIETYLVPTIQNIHRYLIEDGYFLINVNNYKECEHLVQDVKDNIITNGFTLIDTLPLKNITRVSGHRHNDRDNTIAFHDNDERIMVFKKSDDVRICTNCGEVMSSGYVINDGEEYFCSDDCLYGYYSDQEYQELCENDLAYWTEW